MFQPLLASKHHRLRDSNFGWVEAWVWSPTNRKKTKKPRVNHEPRSAHGRAVKKKKKRSRNLNPGLTAWIITNGKVSSSKTSGGTPSVVPGPSKPLTENFNQSKPVKSLAQFKAAKGKQWASRVEDAKKKEAKTTKEQDVLIKRPCA